MRQNIWRTILAAGLLVGGGCGSSNSVGNDGGGNPGADLAGNGSTDLASAGGTDMATGTPSDLAGYVPGTATGTIGGMTFATPMSSLFFENVDASNGVTCTVVYLYSGNVQCSDIQAAGWDTRLPPGTQILELKMWGTTPAMDYTVTASMTPAAGEAATSYSVAAPTTNDNVGTGGKVRLDTRTANVAAAGTFMVTWSNGSLTGTYNAKFCSGGMEP